MAPKSVRNHEHAALFIDGVEVLVGAALEANIGGSVRRPEISSEA
jgi:hypothetical protein